MTTSFVIRVAKIVLVASWGSYAALVTFGNVTDPMANFRFVEHVLMMDTTFRSEALAWHAVDSGFLHQVAFGMIVLTEALSAGFCLYGAFRLFAARGLSESAFHAAKAPALWGLLAGLVLFFFGFQVVGGEWFASWQSEVWNGLDSASRATIFLLGSLIFVSLPND